MKNNIKFKAHECDHIYGLMFHSKRKLTDGTKSTDLNVKGYLEKLDELTALAKSSSDTVLQFRLDGLRDAGVVLVLIE